MRFQDKIVIVTGAAGGIGTAIAQRFASEGARVIVTDVNADGVEATAAAIRAKDLSVHINNYNSLRVSIRDVTDAQVYAKSYNKVLS